MQNINKILGNSAYSFKKLLPQNIIDSLNQSYLYKILREKRLTIRTKTLANILEEHEAPGVIDYLSIDVEGAETRILADFPFNKYIFNSMTIERPSEFLHNLLIEKGYIWVKLIPGLDSFYIHESFQKIYGLNQCSYYRTLRSMY